MCKIHFHQDFGKYGIYIYIWGHGKSTLVESQRAMKCSRPSDGHLPTGLSVLNVLSVLSVLNVLSVLSVPTDFPYRHIQSLCIERLLLLPPEDRKVTPRTFVVKALVSAREGRGLMALRGLKGLRGLWGLKGLRGMRGLMGLRG